MIEGVGGFGGRNIGAAKMGWRGRRKGGRGRKGKEKKGKEWRRGEKWEAEVNEETFCDADQNENKNIWWWSLTMSIGKGRVGS